MGIQKNFSPLVEKGKWEQNSSTPLLHFFVVLWISSLSFPFHVSLIQTIYSEANTVKRTIQRKTLTRKYSVYSLYVSRLARARKGHVLFLIANQEEAAKKKTAYILTSLSQLVLFLCVAWILISVIRRSAKCNTMKQKFNRGKTSLDGFKPPSLPFFTGYFN